MTSPAALATAGGSFGTLDWMVLGLYLLVVVGLGVLVSRRNEQGDDFFLAGRSMPIWAVAISTLATAMSAASFIGMPQHSYRGDLSFMSFKAAGLIAFLVVGFLFLPAIFRAGTPSVYGLIAQRLGDSAGGASAVMFGIGRLLASGARLFMTAIPFSLVAFGEATGSSLIYSILVVAAIASIYTMLGGVRAVIWTDVLQASVMVGTASIAFILLWSNLGTTPAEAMTLLREASSADGGSGKLQTIDWSLSWTDSYTVWSAALGLVFFLIAAYGTDQDLAQRLLTCPSPKRAAVAGILSNLIGWPVTILFLGLGLLLWLEEHVNGQILPGLAGAGDRDVFLRFILRDMPLGLRGLMMAGLFAAAMSSLDSALNALAASTLSDVVRPWRRSRGYAALSPARETRWARVTILAWTVALTLFAVICSLWQEASGTTLLDFALGVMVFAYAGLLGVFLTVLLTPRGNGTSAIAALITGFVVVLLLQPFAWNTWMPWVVGPDHPPAGALPWKMVIAASCAFLVCLTGSRRG